MSTDSEAGCIFPSTLNPNTQTDYSSFEQAELTSELFEICKKYGIDLNHPAQPGANHLQLEKTKNEESASPLILNEHPTNIPNMEIEVEKLAPSSSFLAGLLSPHAPSQSTGSKPPLFPEYKSPTLHSPKNPYPSTPNTPLAQNRFNSSKETVKYAKISELPRPRARPRAATVSKTPTKLFPFEGAKQSDTRAPFQPSLEYKKVGFLPVADHFIFKQKETVSRDSFLNVLLNNGQLKFEPPYQSTKTEIATEVPSSEATRVPTVTTSESEVSGQNLLQAAKEIDFTHFNSIQNEGDRQDSKNLELLSEVDRIESSRLAQKKAEIQEIQELLDTFTKESRPQILMNPLRKKLKVLQKEIEGLLRSQGAISSNFHVQKYPNINSNPLRRSIDRDLATRSQSASKVETRTNFADRKSDIENFCLSIKQKHRLIREQKENFPQTSSLTKQIMPIKQDTYSLFERFGNVKMKENMSTFISTELLQNELSFCGRHIEQEYEYDYDYELINNLR